MRYFKNPKTGEVHAYDETDPNAAPYIAKAIKRKWGVVPVWPLPPTPAELGALQIQRLVADCQALTEQPVTFTTAAGTTDTYQADAASVARLQAAIVGFQKKTPAGFYWLSASNVQVPFTFADLQALASLMLAQGWGAFQRLTDAKVKVRAGVAAGDATLITGVTF